MRTVNKMTELCEHEYANTHQQFPMGKGEWVFKIFMTESREFTTETFTGYYQLARRHVMPKARAAGARLVTVSHTSKKH